jgi:transposase
MGAKIPRKIRLEVIRKWLQGKSRDQIANKVGIGAGTVSLIIKEYRSGDFDADLLREVALNLKNSGLDIHKFAPLVRLREVLEDKEWILGVRPGQEQEEGENQKKNDFDIDNVSEKTVESLIMSQEVFCFKEVDLE